MEDGSFILLEAYGYFACGQLKDCEPAFFGEPSRVVRAEVLARARRRQKQHLQPELAFVTCDCGDGVAAALYHLDCRSGGDMRWTCQALYTRPVVTPDVTWAFALFYQESSEAVRRALDHLFSWNARQAPPGWFMLAGILRR